MGTWDQLTAGQGTAVVWASTSPTFAVLYAPHAVVPEFSGRFSRKKAKAREEEFMRQSAIAAAAANAEQAVCVQVCDHPAPTLTFECGIACVTYASVRSARTSRLLQPLYGVAERNLCPNVAVYEALLRITIIRHMQILEVNEGTKAVTVVNGRLSVGAHTPVKLHGGALLGISLNSAVKSGSHGFRAPCACSNTRTTLTCVLIHEPGVDCSSG